MPDSDKVLELLIKLTADTYGAEKVQNALNGLKGTARGAGEDVKKLEVNSRELRLILRGLGPEASHLGHLMHVAFENQGLAGILLVSAAIGVLVHKIEEYKKHLEELNKLEGDKYVAAADAKVKAMSEAAKTASELTAKMRDAAQAQDEWTQAEKRYQAILEERFKTQKKLDEMKGMAAGAVEERELLRKREAAEQEAERLGAAAGTASDKAAAARLALSAFAGGEPGQTAAATEVAHEDTKKKMQEAGAKVAAQVKVTGEFDEAAQSRLSELIAQFNKLKADYEFEDKLITDYNIKLAELKASSTKADAAMEELAKKAGEAASNAQILGDRMKAAAEGRGQIAAQGAGFNPNITLNRSLARTFELEQIVGRGGVLSSGEAGEVTTIRAELAAEFGRRGLANPLALANQLLRQMQVKDANLADLLEQILRYLGRSQQNIQSMRVTQS